VIVALQVIERCAQCDDDCHPLRISGNQPATEDCRKKCGCMFMLFCLHLIKQCIQLYLST